MPSATIYETATLQKKHLAKKAVVHHSKTDLILQYDLDQYLKITTSQLNSEPLQMSN